MEPLALETNGEHPGGGKRAVSANPKKQGMGLFRRRFIGTLGAIAQARYGLVTARFRKAFAAWPFRPSTVHS